MSRRARITYPHANTPGASAQSEKYHVGSIVFLPFVITDDYQGEWGVEASHDVLQNYDGGHLAFTIPKEILP